MNLPNRITLARFGMALALFVFMEVWCGEAGPIWYGAFVLFVLTVGTDGLDGYLARRLNQVTTFGRIADPFVDKVVISGVLVLTLAHPATTAFVPTWLVILVLAREFLVSGLRGFLEGRGETFAASWEGKTKMVLQAVFCGTVLFYPGHSLGWVATIAEIGLWVVAAVTAWSATSYVRRAARSLRSGGA